MTWARRVPVDVEDVNVICAQFFQAITDRDMHALGRVPSKVALEGFILEVPGSVGGGIFSCYHHLISISTLLHPFTDKPLRVLMAVDVGSVNEIAA